jgi:hypothetical protein
MALRERCNFSVTAVTRHDTGPQDERPVRLPPALKNISRHREHPCWRDADIGASGAVIYCTRVSGGRQP